MEIIKINNKTLKMKNLIIAIQDNINQYENGFLTEEMCINNIQELLNTK